LFLSDAAQAVEAWFLKISSKKLVLGFWYLVLGKALQPSADWDWVWVTQG
jgi:hypothetical protein